MGYDGQAKSARELVNEAKAIKTVPWLEKVIKRSKPKKISHPLSKQNPEPANDDRELKLSHGQNCPPHSPEETYKK